MSTQEDRSRGRDRPGRPSRRRRARGRGPRGRRRSRARRGVDVITGEGLDDALAGVECIVDAATGPVARRAGGDRVLHHRGPQPAGARRARRRARGSWSCRSSASTASPAATTRPSSRTSRRTLAGPIPVRILRAAQFHEFVEQLDRVGPPGRRGLRAGDAHAARRRAHRGRGARRPGHRGRPSRRPATARSGRSRARARSAWSRSARLLAARAASPRGSRTSTRPTALYETGGSLPGPDATLAGPTFDEWLDSHVIA